VFYDLDRELTAGTATGEQRIRNALLFLLAFSFQRYNPRAPRERASVQT
jgi:hypothetical protein